VTRLPLGNTNEAAVAEAMKRLWVQYLPKIEERVLELEMAAAACINGNLTEHQREQARAAAHKLAGVLGTFGLDRGTQLAREVELYYSDPNAFEAGHALRPAEIAAQIRAIVTAKP
jgi:HPt (histidine-containing phosphotransfer) domain-containing protein